MGMSDPVRFANKLNRLFATVGPGSNDRHQRRREYSNEHVASEIGRLSGVSISQSYIWQLRKGKKDNRRCVTCRR